MRTRSQQASPGGFVSLDDERAPRRTRAARRASRQPSTEPSESTQPTQPATRSKTQRTTKKVATTKKTTKNQTQKPTKRTTRQTTRNTDNPTSGDEGQESFEVTEQTETSRRENKENPEADPEAPETATLTQGTALLEPRSSERESQTFITPSQDIDSPHDLEALEPPHDLEALATPIDLEALELPHDPNEPPNPQDPQEPPFTPNIFDYFFDLPDCGDIEPSWYDWSIEEIDGILALSPGPDSPWLNEDETYDELPDDLIAELEAALALHDAEELETAQTEEDKAEEDTFEEGRVEERKTNATRESSIDGNTSVPVAVPVDVPCTPEQAVAEPTTVEAKNQEQPEEVKLSGESEHAQTVFALASTVDPRNETALAEPVSLEAKNLEQSEEVKLSGESEQAQSVFTLAPAVHPGEETVAVDEPINILAQLFERLSLVDAVPCSSRKTAVPLMTARLPETTAPENVTALNFTSDRLPALVSGAFAHAPPMASIYSDVPPVCPSFNVLMPAERVQQRRSTIFTSPIPITPASIYEPGQQIVERALLPVVLEEDSGLNLGPSLCPAGTGPVEPLQTTSTPARKRKSAWVGSVLSPIPEEPEPGPSPRRSAGTCQASLKNPSAVTSQDAPNETSKSPLVPPAVTSQDPPNQTPRNLLLSPTVTVQDATHRAPKNHKLTPRKVNRKRTHSSLSNDHQAEPETPQTNKRRNLGPPGSTPYTRRLTPLSRRLSTTAVPYSERLRRRRAESQGRIHRTVFRLPQLVAQNEADRLALEAPAEHPCPEPPQSNFDFSVDQTSMEQSVSNQPTTAQEPSTPEPTQRSWNIRGLLNSVPRSFSRFLPSFGRTPERAEALGAQQPSSECTRRTRDAEVDSITLPQKRGIQSGRRLSDQPPAKRARNLSYSLFPAPIDRSLYLKDVPKTHTAPQAAATGPAEKEAMKKVEVQITTMSSSEKALGRGRDTAAQETAENSNTAQKKRKRSLSPDVIPNPAGSSYGMDLDYFCYSSDSEGEEDLPAPRTEPRKITEPFTKGDVARNAIQSERPASKKVRFDASPEDTPSKLRVARATDPYRGKHFIGMGGPSIFSAPTSPTPSSRDSQPPQRSLGFIPNKQGTFTFDYDDDSESSEVNSRASVSTPVTPETRTPIQSSPPESVPSTAARQAPRQTAPPATPAKVDEEALAKARSQAEKYKPKTPSGLRTASRYSSPMTATPDLTPAAPAAQTTQKFGDDEFAKDAQWLYENCPSGDLRQLVWPPKQGLAESLNIRPSSLQLLSEIWDDSEVERGYQAFKRSFNEFKKTLA